MGHHGEVAVPKLRPAEQVREGQVQLRCCRRVLRRAKGQLLTALRPQACLTTLLQIRLPERPSGDPAILIPLRQLETLLATLYGDGALRDLGRRAWPRVRTAIQATAPKARRARLRGPIRGLHTQLAALGWNLADPDLWTPRRTYFH